MKQINGKRAVLENGVLRKEIKFGFSWGAFLAVKNKDKIKWK